MYSGYGVACDESGFWNSDNDFAWNDLIFGVNSSSPSYADNRKKSFFVFGEGLINDINGIFATEETNFTLVTQIIYLLAE